MYTFFLIYFEMFPSTCKCKDYRELNQFAYEICQSNWILVLFD